MGRERDNVSRTYRPHSVGRRRERPASIYDIVNQKHVMASEGRTCMRGVYRRAALSVALFV